MLVIYIYIEYSGTVSNTPISFFLSRAFLNKINVLLLMSSAFSYKYSTVNN